MNAQKTEFKKLIEIAGWSQTEVAKRLGKTPSAINHLLNPKHPNKPTQTTMRLLKMIVARERPERVNTQTFERKGIANDTPASTVRLSASEGELIRRLRQLSVKDQEKAYAVIKAVLLLARGGKKPKK